MQSLGNSKKAAWLRNKALRWKSAKCCAMNICKSAMAQMIPIIFSMSSYLSWQALSRFHYSRCFCSAKPSCKHDSCTFRLFCGDLGPTLLRFFFFLVGDCATSSPPSSSSSSSSYPWRRAIDKYSRDSCVSSSQRSLFLTPHRHFMCIGPTCTPSRSTWGMWSTMLSPTMYLSSSTAVLRLTSSSLSPADLAAACKCWWSASSQISCLCFLHWLINLVLIVWGAFTALSSRPFFVKNSVDPRSHGFKQKNRWPWTCLVWGYQVLLPGPFTAITSWIENSWHSSAAPSCWAIGPSSPMLEPLVSTWQLRYARICNWKVCETSGWLPIWTLQNTQRDMPLLCTLYLHSHSKTWRKNLKEWP